MARQKKQKLPKTVADAIKSGHKPVLRNWRDLPVTSMTQGERVCAFIERMIPVPEGPLVGQPMRLMVFQQAFILSLFDGKVKARKAILSVGRKAGKTALVSALMLSFMFMDGLTARNSRINSAALSRDQAALVYNYMSKSIQLSPVLSKISKITPSGRRITALNTGIEYQALAAEAGKAMGLSPAVAVGDEWGQVVGPSHPFIDAILTSQGAHEHPLAIIISTQAPSDADYLSVVIDDATRNPTDEVVCHLYTADPALELDDPKAWEQACPAIGEFRNAEDVRMQAEQAKRLPMLENSFRNLILNQRVALVSAFLAPAPYKECGKPPDMDVFRRGPTAIALDLSARNDLTAAVLAAADEEGFVHVYPFVFCPTEGITERSQRDRAPYDQFVRDGHMIGLGGKTMDYEQIATYLRDALYDMGIEINWVVFDRWGIQHFKKAAADTGFAQSAEWIECGQGYKDFSPRCKAFESLILQGKVRHGSHPLLNLAFSNAIAEMDPSGNVKLAKNKSTQRIDPAIACVMAAFQVSEGNINPALELDALIG